MRRRTAFRNDRLAQKMAGAAAAMWWTAAAAATRRVTNPGSSKLDLESEPPPAGFVRGAWREAFDKDAEAVGEGLLPPRLPLAFDAIGVVPRFTDLVRDARAVEQRRRRRGAIEARRNLSLGRGYPGYYRRNFHFQSGGWFTPESARRYEDQVELLFAGAAGPMRRSALALLASAWRDKDHRGRTILDLACGAGGFLVDLEACWPRARLIGLDLSAPYLAEAGRRAAAGRMVQAKAEQLPLPDAALDAITCIYLFHELPSKVRTTVAGEIARTLKPGGHFAFADALQPTDEPRLARLLEAFPHYFHEPFFASYARADLVALFSRAGLRLLVEDRSFLTKAMLFEKPSRLSRRRDPSARSRKAA
ncbi:MAG: class I SAM-dependent methyltransferase [Caulobacteraceae bacterium]